MLPDIDSILSRIADGSLFPSGYYSALDRDSALTARNTDPSFDTTWIAAYEQIEAAWASSLIDDQQRALVERIRREAFEAVSGTTSQHEIASYVSDDLDLIARGAVLGLSSPVLNSLWASYEKGEFPTATSHSLPDTRPVRPS